MTPKAGSGLRRRTLLFPYVTSKAHNPTATIAMGDVEEALGFAVRDLSDQNYPHSLAFCRLWIDIGQTHLQIPHDKIFDAIWNNRMGNSFHPSGGSGELIHSTAHLLLRLASDVEPDYIPAPQSSGLQNHLCTKSLRGFFTNNLLTVSYKMKGYVNNAPDGFYADVNLIAQLANLGYVEEAVIRNHVLQSLISHPKLYDHQAHALIILFKLAGATFEAYADASVVDRCVELLRNHYGSGTSLRARQTRVRVPHPAMGGHGLKQTFRR